MATTAKPNKRTTAKKSTTGEAPTSAAAWKKGTSSGTLVRVPSGKLIRIKTPGMGVFMKSGIVPNALMPIIQEAMKQGKEPTEEDMAKMLGDTEMIAQIAELADEITIFCALDPQVNPVPETEDDRSDELLYVDEIDFGDKMYIFSVAVGGVAAYERFRQESGLDVGPVSER